MEREALKIALDYVLRTTHWTEGRDRHDTLKAIKEALAQPEQEPVCPACKAGVLYECVACSSNNYPPQGVQEPWRESASDYERGVIDGRQMQAQSSVDKAVNAMTQRPWVGLMDEQIADYLGDKYHAMTESELRFFRLGEAAAKEKNNG